MPWRFCGVCLGSGRVGGEICEACKGSGREPIPPPPPDPKAPDDGEREPDEP